MYPAGGTCRGAGQGRGIDMRRGIIAAAIFCACGVLTSAPQAAAASTLGDWSTFHGDAMHDGVSSDTTIGAASASKLGVKWSKSIDGSPVFSSPMVVYNTTLAEKLVYDVSVAGTVEAFDAGTGAMYGLGASEVASWALRPLMPTVSISAMME